MLHLIKIVVGIFASLFALLHMLALFQGIVTGADKTGPFGPTEALAHITGIAIGLLIGLLCFHTKKNAGRDDHEEPAQPSTVQSGDGGRLPF